MKELPPRGGSQPTILARYLRRLSKRIHYITLIVCLAIWSNLVYYSNAVADVMTAAQQEPCKQHQSQATPSTNPSGAGVPCFLTVQMAANGDFLEPIQNLDDIGIRLPGYRYIVMTNDESLDAQDWEKVVLRLDRTKFTRVKTHVTYAKFMAWKHPALRTCRTVFVMDALNVPVNNATVWQELERRMEESPGNLVALLKPNNATNLDHTLRLPKLKKETKEMAKLTHDWLASRSDYDPATLCLWTNFFAYNPTNELFRVAATEFWQYYSMEMLTARDQPLWSYFVQRWKLYPQYVRLFDDTMPERRPHVHVCAERDRLLCELNPERMDCEASTGGRYQHRLLGVQDPTRINCEKRPGAHTMSVLEHF